MTAKYCVQNSSGQRREVEGLALDKSLGVRDYVKKASWACIRGVNVEIALIKGGTIALSCRDGKIPYNQICFLTSFEPNKVYLGPNRNNEGVRIIYFPARNIPISLDFLLFVLLALRAALPSPTATPVIDYCDPPLP